MTNQSRLEMIQAIISRLAGNSSAFKGWMVTITAALLGVAINNKNQWLAWFGVYAIVVLALLDSYYLALEKSFRDLYNAAIGQDKSNWSLTPVAVKLPNVLKALRSPSVWPFYASALAACVVVALTVKAHLS
jgi:hypothetical protein